MKVYFGHQSVGRNILEGLETWKEETKIDLEVTESRDFSTVPGSPFVHFAIGNNGDLRGKVDDCVSLVETIPSE